MKKIAIILLGILCSFNSFAQKLNEIDDSLAQMFSSLNAIQFADSAALATGSALAKAHNSNQNIQSYLISVLRNTPATINADFRKSVNEGLEICPSPDHKVRIYSWNSRENGDGTLKMTRKVYQCGSRSSMCVSEALYIDDTTKGVCLDGLCSSILSINTIDKKTVYLEIDYHINFPQDHNEIITAFIIDKGRHPLEYDLLSVKGRDCLVTYYIVLIPKPIMQNSVYILVKIKRRYICLVQMIRASSAATLSIHLMEKSFAQSKNCIYCNI